MKKRQEQDDSISLMQFLMGFNESAVQGQILLMQPLPTFLQSYSMITQEEKQRTLGTNRSSNEPAAMVIRDNCSSASNNSERKPLHCTHCDMDHHTIDIYHKLHGYPLGTDFTSLVQPPVRTSAKLLENGLVVVLPIMPLLAVVLLCKIFKLPCLTCLKTSARKFTRWWVRILTHAKEHHKPMLLPPTDLQVFLKCYQIYVGLLTIVLPTTSCRIQIYSTKRFPIPLFCRSLYLVENRHLLLPPEHHLSTLIFICEMCCVCLHFKLNSCLSIILQVDYSAQWLFFPSWCILQDLKMRTMIGLGKKRDGLYYLVAFATDITPSHNQPSCHLITQSTKIWHLRLGQISFSRFQLLDKHLDCLFSLNHVCDAYCHFAKQTRLPFAINSISTERPFYLIHCGIWEPHKVSSINGARFFLTIVVIILVLLGFFLCIINMKHKGL